MQLDSTVQAVLICVGYVLVYAAGMHYGMSMCPKPECKNCGSRKRIPKSGCNVKCARCGAAWDPVYR